MTAKFGMTAQKAIKLIKDCGLNIEQPLHDMVADCIVTVLEKQTPKKPKIRWNDVWGGCEYFCPICNAEFDMSLYREYRQFCSKCGQKIDWSEENA